MATGTLGSPEQEALVETCKVFNTRREAEGQKERMWPVLILNGTKKGAELCDYGVSLSIGFKDGIPQHRYITSQIKDLSMINKAALAMHVMIKEAMAANRVGKLPWHTKGEARTSEKRWEHGK